MSIRSFYGSSASHPLRRRDRSAQRRYQIDTVYKMRNFRQYATSIWI